MDGKSKFIKYAIPPNKYGYCGPKQSWALFEYLDNPQKGTKIEKILKEFQGAYPYLKLIAQENKISDPFDDRVIEAYWIGNNLLNNVGKKKMAQNITDRFKNRIQKRDFHRLMSKIDQGVSPYHQFHVFDIFTKTGLSKSNQKDKVLKTMDKCRISWGKIKKIEDHKLIIDYFPLVWESKLNFGKKFTKIVIKGLVENPKKGDWVSVHWDWACDILDLNQVNNLKYYTQKYLDLANLTL